MQFLVEATGGPGFAAPDEAVEIIEDAFLPGLDQLLELAQEKKVVAGGVPVGDRGVVFILEADSIDEADRILRSLSLWGVLEWNVRPLQSLAGRAEIERQVVAALKSVEAGGRARRR